MLNAIKARLVCPLSPGQIHRGLLFFSALGICFLIPASGFAQIIPDAPVKNFRLPMFGDEGYRIWDLRGEEGRYISENQIDVIGMHIQVFSGDETDVLETQIRSPKATVLIRKDEARGSDSIWVAGDNFQVTGENWLWQRTDTRIVIEDSVEVIFFEELSGLFSGEDHQLETAVSKRAEGEGKKKASTTIRSDSLEMQSTGEGARFVFSGNVRVTGNNLAIACDQMEVLSASGDDPEGKAGEIGRIQRIIATGQVHIVQEGREATAGRAELLPQDGQVVLMECPVIRDSQGTVSGGRITFMQDFDRAVVESAKKNRVRVELASIPNLGLDGEIKPEQDSPTEIQSDRLDLQGLEEGARFVFSGDVRVAGNNLAMSCDEMEVLSVRSADDPKEVSDELGSIATIIATGRVHITQDGREATAGRAELLPQEGRVILMESPMIRDSQGTISGGRITFLQRGSHLVESVDGEAVRVELASIPNLGAEGEPETEEEYSPTEIQSDTLEIQSIEEGVLFVFSGNVRVAGTGLVMTCDRMEILSSNTGGEDVEEEPADEFGQISIIVATGDVRIVQEGREATAGRAEILPQEGKVVLAENPVIRDSEGTVSGGRMTLLQGVRRVVVESGEGNPSRVEIPSLPNRGFEENAD